MPENSLDILIIGAGQAGLALGYHLMKTPLRFQIVERHKRIGDNWRKRYDSLVLFTPRAYSALPGLPMSGDPDGYAARDEFADYLEAYSRHFELPVALGTGIRRLERQNGRFCAASETGEMITSRVIVLATGGFQIPSIPASATGFSGSVQQFTMENYKNPRQIPPGKALVVGDGASGRDIAVDLAPTHAVVLATGKPRRLIPERFLGRSVWWWLSRLGLLDAPAESLVGRYIRKTEPFPNRERDFKSLRKIGIRIVPSLSKAAGRSAEFANGETMEVNSVIWATGYRDDSDWVAIPEIKDSRGSFMHTQGISPVPNLYLIGRPWQRSRGSAFIAGVGADAAFITEKIMRSLQSLAPSYVAFAIEQDPLHIGSKAGR